MNECGNCIRNVKRLNFNRGVPHWRNNCVACTRSYNAKEVSSRNRKVDTKRGTTNKATRGRSRSNC